MADRRSRAFAHALFGSLAACSPSLHFLPTPDAPDWARSVVLLVDSGDTPRAMALALDGGPPSSEPIRIEPPPGDLRGAAVWALFYPHSLESMFLKAGPLSLGGSAGVIGHLFTPGLALVAPLDGGWRAAMLPDRLHRMSLELHPLDAAPDQALSVATANASSCVLLGSGSVRCFGNNDLGQLARTSPQQTGTPTIAERPVSVIALSAGADHFCSRDLGGRVLCWGASREGELGRPPSSISVDPSPVEQLDDAVSVATSGHSSCALLSTGSVSCWGGNGNGELGRPTAAPTGTNTPLEVPQLPAPVVELVGGARHYCARLIDGQLWCWGDDSEGQLGSAPPGELHRAPAMVLGVTGAIAVAAGAYDSCALLGSGELWCWGEQDQLGRPPTPSKVTQAGANERLIATGVAECLIDDQGRARCFGSSTSLILPASDPLHDPQGLAPLGGLRNLACGFPVQHCCAIGRAGGLWCWGWNGYGEAGQPAPEAQATAVEVPGLSGIARVVVESDLSCGLPAGPGPVSCFGARGISVIMTDQPIAPSPVRLGLPVPEVFELSMGNSQACARTSTSGPIVCWGISDQGQLGDGAVGRAPRGPIPVAGTDGAHGLSSRRSNTCAITPAGEVICWGANFEGELGNGAVDPPPAAAGEGAHAAGLVIGLPGPIRQLGLGDESVCAVTEQGEVWCWGYNKEGEVGNARAGVAEPVPVQVSGVTGAVEVACGLRHCCARLSGGAVTCWGRNAEGELGNGGFDGGPRAVPMGGIDDAVQLSLYYDTSCVLRSGGTVVCAGLGWIDGQPHPSPEPLPGFRDIVSFGIALSHVCGADRSGKMFCLGADRWGQLGLGAPVVFPRATPVRF